MNFFGDEWKDMLGKPEVIVELPHAGVKKYFRSEADAIDFLHAWQDKKAEEYDRKIVEEALAENEEMGDSVKAEELKGDNLIQIEK